LVSRADKQYADVDGDAVASTDALGLHWSFCMMLQRPHHGVSIQEASISSHSFDF
jgi:hypothetical protein